MKQHKHSLLLLPVLLAVLPAAFAQRIVTLTPDIADVVVALGAAEEVVARDLTTTNPALKNKPSIGVFRQLSMETIAAQKPDVAIGSWMAQPQSIYSSLNSIGIRAVNVAPKDDLNDYPKSIREIGKLLGKTAKAEALAKDWQARMKPMPSTGKRYLITYDGRIVAGRNTAADELIRRAGGVNAAAGIEGLKPLTREAWAAAKPDVVIVSEHHSKDVGHVDGMLKRPELAASPAAKKRNIHFWPANDIFRYGLDTPQVVQRLNGLAK